MKFYHVLIIFVIVCIVLWFTNILHFLIHVKESSNVSIRSKKVAIYTLSTFHEEVTSSVACILHSLGFYVIVYIGSGYHVGSITLPFSDIRKQRSIQFYGQCVSEWVIIKQGMKIHTDIALLVFITYPMLKSLDVVDQYAIEYLKLISLENNPSTTVAYIVHRTDEFVHPMLLSNEQYIPRNRTHYLTLSLHTYKSVKLEYQKHKNKLGSSELKFGYFYPIIPHIIFNSTQQKSDKETITNLHSLFNIIISFIN